MKKRTVAIIFNFIVFSFVFQSFAQRVSYTYDNAGNRISRMIVLTSPSIQKAQSPDMEEEPYTDFINERQIKIFPNPTKGILAVEVTGTENNTEAGLMLFSMQGELIISKTLEGIRTELNLTGQPAGTYLMQINIENEKTVWKIIKE